MEKMRKVIQNFLAVYMRVVTLVVFVSAVYIVVFWGWKTELDVTILWEILGVSFLTSLGSVIAFPVSDSEKEISKQAMLIRNLLYFLFVNMVVLGCGFWFGWFYISDWRMIAGMEACIVFVYCSVVAISYYMESRVADRMNRKLKERLKKQEK